MTCTAQCWMSVRCPACGNSLGPRGRSMPLEMSGSSCCEDARQDHRVNPRHLWDEHDSTRYYTDPEGWAAHERACEACQPAARAPEARPQP
jgi:hypothetical protein